jgi:hypothetical protein
MISAGNHHTYREGNIDVIFQKIVSNYPALKAYYSNYLLKEYQNESEERNHYYDIARIGDFIREQFKNNNGINFKPLFENIEEILADCDQYTAELIVIGLFEAIQNAGDVNYYTGFNQWLKPLSKSAWDELINFWEGAKAGKKYKRLKK